MSSRPRHNNAVSKKKSNFKPVAVIWLVRSVGFLFVAFELMVFIRTYDGFMRYVMACLCTVVFGKVAYDLDGYFVSAMMKRRKREQLLNLLETPKTVSSDGTPSSEFSFDGVEDEAETARKRTLRRKARRLKMAKLGRSADQSWVWMNQLPFEKNYKPETFSSSDTFSVLLTLRDTLITLRYPKRNLDVKKTIKNESFEEKLSNFQFYGSSKRIALENMAVSLEPYDLKPKKYWNKTYPIVIYRKNKGSKLYLFARTGREKELWFYILTRALGERSYFEESCFFPLDSTRELTLRFKAWTSEHKQASSEEQGWRTLIADLHDERVVFHSLAAINFCLGRCWCALSHNSVRLEGMISAHLLKSVRLGEAIKSMEVFEIDWNRSHPPQIEGISLPWQTEQGILFDVNVTIKGSLVIMVQTKGVEGVFTSKDHRSLLSEKKFLLLLIFNILFGWIGIKWKSEFDWIDAGLIYLALLGFLPLAFFVLHLLGKVGANRQVEDPKENIVYSTRKGLLQDVVKKLTNNVWTPIAPLLRRVGATVTISDVHAIVRVNIPPEPSDRVWVGFALPPDYELTVQLMYPLKDRLIALGKVPFVRIFVLKLEEFLVKKLRSQIVKSLVLPNLKDFRLHFLDSFPAS